MSLDYDNSDESIGKIKEEIVYHVQASNYLVTTTQRLMTLITVPTIVIGITLMVLDNVILAIGFLMTAYLISRIALELNELARDHLKQTDQLLYVMRTVLGLPDPMEGLK